MILDVQRGLAAEGYSVSLVKLCRWFDLPRRTLYYRSVKSPPKAQEQLAEPIKALIEEHPSLGYRTVAHLLGMNKNTVQRIFQLKGWHPPARRRRNPSQASQARAGRADRARGSPL